MAAQPNFTRNKGAEPWLPAREDRSATQELSQAEREQIYAHSSMRLYMLNHTAVRYSLFTAWQCSSSKWTSSRHSVEFDFVNGYQLAHLLMYSHAYKMVGTDRWACLHNRGCIDQPRYKKQSKFGFIRERKFWAGVVVVRIFTGLMRKGDYFASILNIHKGLWITVPAEERCFRPYEARVAESVPTQTLEIPAYWLRTVYDTEILHSQHCQVRPHWLSERALLYLAFGKRKSHNVSFTNWLRCAWIYMNNKNRRNNVCLTCNSSYQHGVSCLKRMCQSSTYYVSARRCSTDLMSDHRP